MKATTETVTITYGKIDGYRDPSRKSWGFKISNPEATFGHVTRYSCVQRSMGRVLKSLTHDANQRGFEVEFIDERKS